MGQMKQFLIEVMEDMGMEEITSEVTEEAIDRLAMMADLTYYKEKDRAPPKGEDNDTQGKAP